MDFSYKCIFSIFNINIYTIGIIRTIYGKVLIDDNKINIMYKNKLAKQINLEDVIGIKYYSIPIIKGIEMIILYQTNKNPIYIDFGPKNHLKLFKYIVDSCKNNNINIDERLIKRVENVKMDL